MTVRSAPRLIALGCTAAVLASTAAGVWPSASAAADEVPVHAVLKLSSRPHARALAERWARDHGLEVTDSGPGFLVVKGTAGTAQQDFAVRSWARPVTAAVPGTLSGAVTSVAGFDTKPLFHHDSVPAGYTGANFDSAYGLPGTASAGRGMTVATIQFSGWNPSDATTYAQAAGIPLAAGQITSISVNGASVSTPDGSGGDVEAALDVEGILAVAPAAKQRVYVTTNDYAGALAAYQQVAADAAKGLVQAVSMSWGMCEAGVNAYTLNSLNSPIAQAVADGASFFSSTGDTGATGCGAGTSQLSVEFPASSPAVVAVGGTTLTHSSAGWSESAWSGSGGGYSSNFPRPSYQSSVSAGGSGRMVPDVAADADANTGIGLYAASQGGWVLGGGTSLASPLWAGMLVAALSEAGHTSGVGDIHAALYAHAGDFREETSGGNGTYHAGPGYNLVTGLGSPDWSRLVSAVLGSAAAPAPSGTQTTSSTNPAPTTSSAPPSSSPAPAPAPATVRSTSHACPSGSVPPAHFTDVSPGDTHGADVACVAWWGVADGTGPTTYSPTRQLTRAQMAAFVARLVAAAGGALPSAPATAFPDVANSAERLQIDQLAAVGIVSGEADGLYHPGQAVTREQLASFVARAYHYATNATLGPAWAGSYPDVPAGDVHAADIKAVAGAGIAVGYPDGSFGPTQAVTRDQVASFLARLLDVLVAQGHATPPVG